MSIEAIIGALMVLFGLLTLVARLAGWSKLISKREQMQLRFGERNGDIIHLVAYTLVPLVVGGLLVFS